MASIKHLVDLDLNQNEIQNAVAQNLASAPSNPVAGQEYFNTTDKQKYIYNGTAWVSETAQGTTYTAGDYIDISNNTISIDSEWIEDDADGIGDTSKLVTSRAVSGLLADLLEDYVPTTRTVNGKALTTNITLDASDVGALADTTKYGATFTLTMDSSTYVITATLKDQDGNTLGTAQTIDLPLESVVVGGSYDSANKKIVLTLENGNTVDVPVGDLINGLQSEITASNMLSADLVDDTSTTHKFATSAQLTQIATNASDISTLQSTVAGLPQKITATNTALTASSGVCTWSITNTLATADVCVSIYRVSDGAQVIAEVDTGANTITVKFNSTSSIAAGTYKAVIIG